MRELPFDLHFDGGDSLDLFTADVRTRFCMGRQDGEIHFRLGSTVVLASGTESVATSGEFWSGIMMGCSTCITGNFRAL